jgi:hypothetical protein
MSFAASRCFSLSRFAVSFRFRKSNSKKKKKKKEKEKRASKQTENSKERMAAQGGKIFQFKLVLLGESAVGKSRYVFRQAPIYIFFFLKLTSFFFFFSLSFEKSGIAICQGSIFRLSREYNWCCIFDADSVPQRHNRQI